MTLITLAIVTEAVTRIEYWLDFLDFDSEFDLWLLNDCILKVGPIMVTLFD